MNLRVSKKGNSGLGGPPGDLMIQVKVKPHAYFKRDGSDIHADLFISISDVSIQILASFPLISTTSLNILFDIRPYLAQKFLSKPSTVTFE